MANKKLNAVITIGGALAGSFRTVIGSTTKELGKIGTEINKVKQNQRQLGEAIRTFGGMGKNVDNLRTKYSLVTAELNKLTKAQEKLNAVESLRKKSADVRSGATKVLGGSVAAAATMIVPVKLAIDFESSMADVKKVFNGTDSQFKTITNEILKMSTVLPMSANDIAKIVASGAQSGIAANELTKFAESAVKMGVAFDISADEAGQSMAEMRTAFKLNQDQVVELADKINYLGNNTPAAAKGIMQIVQRIGPLGQVGGFASGSIAALGATLRGMGVQEEIAATGIKNMMLSLVAGESATKSQNAAFNKLGLDSTKISKQMQQDANGTTLEVLKAVSKLDKAEQASVLQNLFGKESLGAIAPLLTNMNELQKNLDMVADKTKYAGSMEQEYVARAATTANNIQLFKNKIAGLGIGIGSVLLPPLNIFLGKMGAVVSKVSDWSKANPVLSSTLTKIAVGAVIAVGGISALAIGVTTGIGPIALAVSSFSVLGGSAGTAITILSKMIAPIKMIGTVFGIVGKAMLANPMILAITAIVAVVAGAAYLIYKNWQPITTFFTRVWEGVKNVFGEAVNFIKDIIQSVDNVFAENPLLNLLIPLIGLPRLIITNWSSIKSFFSDVWSGISAVVNVAINTISAVISSGMNTIGTFMTSAWNVIKNIVSIAWQGLCNVFLTVTPLGFVIQNFNSIKSFLLGLGTEFLTIGRNIVDGLINGIMSGFDKLKGVWTTINNYMPSFMKKKMDIHSPSRVMAGLGGFIVDGIGVGMDDRTPALKQGFSRVLDTFSTNQNSFNSQPPALRGGASPTMPNGSGTVASAGYDKPNQTITIIVNGSSGQDVNQLANLVVEKLKHIQGVQQRSTMVDWGYSQ